MNEIFKQLFAVIGKEYNPKFLNEERWWERFEWTHDQKSDFANWLFLCLKENKAAREKLMHPPVKNTQAIENAVNEFIKNYGWREEPTRRQASHR